MTSYAALNTICSNRTNDVCRGNSSRVDLDTAHSQARCAVASTAGDHHDVHITVIVKCCGVVRTSRQRSFLCLNGQLVQQDVLFLHHCNAVIDLHSFSGRFFLCLLGSSTLIRIIGDTPTTLKLAPMLWQTVYFS